MECDIWYTIPGWSGRWIINNIVRCKFMERNYFQQWPALAFHSYIQLVTRSVHRTWQSKLACQPAGHRHVSAIAWQPCGNSTPPKKNACVFLRSDAFLLRFSTPAVREYFESLGLDISVPRLTQDESALPCCASKPSPNGRFISRAAFHPKNMLS